ncbi:MAG: methyltransferase [Verrucomicrobia bacterium]|nr:methyltransferase [Verrucomicrobiota bacterium]
MTSRERVRRTLKFQSPDRPPRDLWALPAVDMTQRAEYVEVLRRFPLDMGKPYFGVSRSECRNGSYAQTGSYRDDWGSVWQVAEPGVMGEVKQPAIPDWADLKRFRPPWAILRERDLSGVNADCERQEVFMLSDVAARPFERMQFLRGSENLFMDLAHLPAEVFQLLEMVHAFCREDIAQWGRTAVDGIVMMDDWGAQRGLLIAPELWRKMFKPLYREYCEQIHQAGKYAFFHSDGDIAAIFGDLIEVGMDAINSQLFCMNLEDLARRYKGKVTFWGEIDRQRVLPFGAPEEVKAAVRRVRAALDDGRGGVIAQCEWGKNNPKSNIEMVFAAWNEPARRLVSDQSSVTSGDLPSPLITKCFHNPEP